VTLFSVTLLPDVSGHIRIAWQAPENLTVSLLGYLITYRVVGVGNCNETRGTSETVLPQIPDGISSYVLVGLLPWLKYRVSVLAVNIGGAGRELSADVITRGSGKRTPRVIDWENHVQRVFFPTNFPAQLMIAN